jgi:ABC-type transport system substrate-binding protein
MNCGALINKIVMVEYPSKAALVAAAAAGTVDATWNWDNRYVPLLHRSRSFTTHTIPTDGVDGLVFNEDSSYRGAPNPLANVKVRQALALAVDKVRMTQLAYGVGRATARRFQAWNVWVNMPSYRIFAPYLDRSINGQWDPIDQRYRSDTGSPDAVSHARKLLAQTPWERGFPLDLYVFSPENCGVPFRCAEAAALGSVEADWKKLGVSVHTHYISAQTLGAPWQQGGIEARGAFQATLLIWSTGDPYDWRPLFDSRLIERDRTDHSGPPLCCNAGVRDQAIDRAFDRAGSPSVSMAVRRQMYGFIQRRLNHQVHALPMYYWMATSTTNKHARTLTFGPNLNASWQNGQFWNPYAWSVQSG